MRTRPSATRRYRRRAGLPRTQETAGLPSVRTLKAAARAGDAVAAHNIPIAYRDAGNLRRAVFWWQRFAAAGDGDAALDLGYAYQYGFGVRRAPERAVFAYRQAIRSHHITEYGREEALYHLAVLTLDGDGARAQRAALALLRRAARDGDFAQAARLAAALQRRARLSICRCRRGRGRSIRAQAACAHHGLPRR
jgi:TPR repeat protein